MNLEFLKTFTTAQIEVLYEALYLYVYPYAPKDVTVSSDKEKLDAAYDFLEKLCDAGATEGGS